MHGTINVKFIDINLEVINKGECLSFAIPKCLTHIYIYNDVLLKHNKNLLCVLLY